MKPAEEAPKQKCRHIVTWSPQEDDVLREQIRIHGTESWTAIASRFKDKTSRQCRRRWYTYLNTDCKKGGWSPEEDVLLCEAQKIFGNRWTEIAKVVAGRTDNAVKNRFTTLCKKRAKQEALSKENSTVCINANNKRVILQNGSVASEIFESQAPPIKKIREYNSDLTENCSRKSVGECGVEKQHLLRPPLSPVQNKKGIDHSTQQCLFSRDNMVPSEASDNTDQDPKAVALMQQQEEEQLNSPATKVSDDTHQVLENAWKELQHFLTQPEESELLRYKILEMDSLLEDFKHLVQDTKGNAGSWPSWRQPDWHEESQGSSEYSSGSTHQWHSSTELIEGHPSAEYLKHNSGARMKEKNGDMDIGGSCRVGICGGTSPAQDIIFPPCDELRGGDGISVVSNTEFSSPVRTFQSFGGAIASPKFSDSERQFLLRTLGLVSPSSSNSNTNPSCKRALLDSL